MPTFCTKRTAILLLVALPVIVSCSRAPSPKTDHAATFTEWAVACDHEVASQAGEPSMTERTSTAPSSSPILL